MHTFGKKEEIVHTFATKNDVYILANILTCIIKYAAPLSFTSFRLPLYPKRSLVSKNSCWHTCYDFKNQCVQFLPLKTFFTTTSRPTF